MRSRSSKRHSLPHSFLFAARGVYYALTGERNLRIHVAAGAFALFFSRHYDLSRAELCILILCIGFVLACELVNTAIEKTVDLETASYHYLAKVSKDVAAGAVLVSAATSVAVGFLLFWDPVVIASIWGEMTAHPLRWILAGAAAVLWIFAPRERDSRSR